MINQDVFLERALIEDWSFSPKQMDELRQFGREQNIDLVDALISRELMSGPDVAMAKAEVCEVPFVDLDRFQASFSNTSLIPRALAERYTIFPLFQVDGVLTLAMDDPLNLEAMDDARELSKCDIDSVMCERGKLKELIGRAYRMVSQDEDAPTRGDDVEIDVSLNEAPVVAAVNQLLTDAIARGASDVHINPDEHELRLRFRVDGVLHEVQAPPLSMHAGIVQRLKIMSNLDLTQTRRPQDGKIRFRAEGRAVDIRLSTLPTVCGENVVMRLLGGTQIIQNYSDLGIPADMARDLDHLMQRPYGMMLVTGPTGSGKTTTLYTTLNKLNDPSRNTMTIEDPVEIRLPYVRQVQVRADIGFTFASALRSILRQDPDVVLVGEIRDEETAMIALQAAMTGHLVLSTLHTNDAAGAVSRLRDFGLPPFVINSAVFGVLGQRLVRRVCRHCGIPDTVTDLMRHQFRIDENVTGFRRGKGCSRCGQTGYKGRVGLYELLKFTPDVQRMVENGGSTADIRASALESGMRMMWQDGLHKAQLGETTLEEVTKVAAVLDLRPAGETRKAA